MIIGQKVKLKKDLDIHKDIGVIKKGALYVIQNKLSKVCQCGATYNLVDVGIRMVSQTSTRTCHACTEKIIKESNIFWIQEQVCENAENETETMDKYKAQIDLLRLLANTEMTTQEYHRIMNMLNGDHEMFELASQIILKLRS